MFVIIILFMKKYHLFFYLFIFSILLFIALVSLKIILIKNKIYILIDSLFKISLGLFLIIFFTLDNNHKLDKNDRMLVILSGFVLILLVNYIKLINLLFNLEIKDEEL